MTNYLFLCLASIAIHYGNIHATLEYQPNNIFTVSLTNKPTGQQHGSFISDSKLSHRKKQIIHYSKIISHNSVEKPKELKRIMLCINFTDL